MAQGHLYAHNLRQHSTQHTNITTRCPGACALPPAFCFPASACETSGRNKRQSNSVLHLHKGATVCSIHDWAKNDGDDSDENHSVTKTTGLLVARLRHGLLWYKSTIRQVWLLLLYRWGNYNLEKSKVLSKVTQLVGCMAGLYLITCPKGKRIKWSSLWQP